MSDWNRREFLGAGAALATASSLSFAEEKKRPKIRMAVMGVNGRGRGLLKGFSSFPSVEIAYICEPDSAVVPKAVQILTDQGRPAPKIVTDFREALDDKDVDVLVCAAPDHWHALATILACQAGKDVYVEKPASHNIVEGRRMIDAARHYKKVVGIGTQRRSGADFQEAIGKIREGKLGDLNFARCWINSTRPNIGYVKPSEPPETLDFNQWCGPAPMQDYKTNLLHYHWHWRWDYGTGECGNNGIHALDIARWGMGMEAPDTICCGGGKYFFDDDQETPDTQLATFDFDGGAIQWEHRTWSRRTIEDSSFGIVFYGSEATLVCHGTGWKAYRGDKLLAERKGESFELPHLKNFLDCLETREKPNADIEIGHNSTRLCHLANIAWRTRSTLRFDAKTETIVDNPLANKLLARNSYRKGFELPEIPAT